MSLISGFYLMEGTHRDSNGDGMVAQWQPNEFQLAISESVLSITKNSTPTEVPHSRLERSVPVSINS
jgi:hypothetical protein